MTPGCQGCGAPLAPNRSPGLPRKWCGERCRKAQYQRPCIDCGAVTDGTTPGSHGGRCVGCAHRVGWDDRSEWILTSIIRWHELFGAPPAARDWNATALRSAPRWRQDRKAATGRTWPSPAVVQKHFGSWNAAIRETGLAPRDRP